jgi:hypothetical protein
LKIASDAAFHASVWLFLLKTPLYCDTFFFTRSLDRYTEALLVELYVILVRGEARLQWFFKLQGRRSPKYLLRCTKKDKLLLR